MFVIRRTTDGLYSNGATSSFYTKFEADLKNARVFNTLAACRYHITEVVKSSNYRHNQGAGDPYTGCCEIVEVDIVPRPVTLTLKKQPGGR